MGLMDELNRYLTGRNSAKFLEFACPRCGHIDSFVPEFLSRPGCIGKCGNCSYEYGIHPESVYFRCLCGVGVTGISIQDFEPLNEFHWECSACIRFLFVSEPSRDLCAYLCRDPRCKNARYLTVDQAQSLIDRSFDCSCGRRIRPPSSRFGQNFTLRCPGCSELWAVTDAMWEELLSCGHAVDIHGFESRLLPNIVDRLESPALSTGMSNELTYRHRLTLQTGQLEKRIGANPGRITYRKVIVTERGFLAEELIFE
jgi:hypothetical protein